MTGLYYGPDGEPLTLMEWSAMIVRRGADDARESWWRKQTKVGDREVSTVWLGLDHNWGNGPPLIFESMVFGGGSEDCYRYATKAEAWGHHEELVRQLREASASGGGAQGVEQEVELARDLGDLPA